MCPTLPRKRRVSCSTHTHGQLLSLGGGPNVSEEYCEQINAHDVELGQSGVDQGERMEDKITIFWMIKKKRFKEVPQSL